LNPYIGTNTSKPRTNARLQHIIGPGVFTCPSALKVKMPASEPGADAMKDFFFDNDGVSYVWNHIYLSKDRGGYEEKKPVSGRKDSEIPNPTKATLTWEIPYWNYKYMPHRLGMNLVLADGHAERVKGNPKEEDWWAYHSRDGWEQD
jgi:prepilin-type processing-associated H-X9-DG protein